MDGLIGGTVGEAAERVGLTNLGLAGLFIIALGMVVWMFLRQQRINVTSQSDALKRADERLAAQQEGEDRAAERSIKLMSDMLHEFREDRIRADERLAAVMTQIANNHNDRVKQYGHIQGVMQSVEGRLSVIETASDKRDKEFVELVKGYDDSRKTLQAVLSDVNGLLARGGSLFDAIEKIAQELKNQPEIIRQIVRETMRNPDSLPTKEHAE